MSVAACGHRVAGPWGEAAPACLEGLLEERRVEVEVTVASDVERDHAVRERRVGKVPYPLTAHALGERECSLIDRRGLLRSRLPARRFQRLALLFGGLELRRARIDSGASTDVEHPLRVWVGETWDAVSTDAGSESHQLLPDARVRASGVPADARGSHGRGARSLQAGNTWRGRPASTTAGDQRKDRQYSGDGALGQGARHHSAKLLSLTLCGSLVRVHADDGARRS